MFYCEDPSSLSFILQMCLNISNALIGVMYKESEQVNVPN